MKKNARKSHKYAILAIVSLCLMYTIYTGVLFNNVTLFMDPMLKEFPDWTRTEWMLLITVMSTFNAVGSIVFFTPVTKKLGLKNSRWLAGISLTLACVFIAGTVNLAMFIIAGLLLGFGITFGANATLSAGVNTWFKKHMSTMIAVATACSGVVAIIMAPVIGGWISAIGWRPAFWLITAVCGVGSVVMCLMYKNRPEDVGETAMWQEQSEAAQGKVDKRTAARPMSLRNPGCTFKDMFKTYQFWLICISQFFIGVVMYSVLGNMAIFTSDYGFDVVTQGTVLSVMFAATAIFMIPGGMICDRLGSRIFMLISCACMAGALILLLGTISDITVLYMAAILIGCSYVALNVPLAAVVMEGLGANEFEKKFSFILGVMLAGVAAGNTILQQFYDLSGSYSAGFITYLAAIVSAAAMTFTATSKRAGNGA